MLPAQFPARGWKQTIESADIVLIPCCLLNSPQGDGNTLVFSVCALNVTELPAQFPARGWKQKLNKLDFP